MKGSAVLVGLLAFGCGKRASAPDVHPGDCLSLPGANRAEIAADPAGGGLYWFEPVRGVDYESEVRGYFRLVRYDLAARRMDVIADHVQRPLLFMRDGIVVRTVVGRSNGAEIIRPDGRIDDIVPADLAAVDLEPIDDHTVALLADAPGGRGVYALDLDHGRARYLMSTDSLASTSHGKVIVDLDDEGTAIDVATGKHELASWPKHYIPNGSVAFGVEGKGLRETSMLTPEAHAIPAPPGDWHVLIETGAVIARTSPDHDLSHAMVLRDGSAITLPDVHGGTIMGATQLAGAWWALVAHNTSNYAGDYGDTNSETDVCLLPAAGTVAFEERSVPSRFRAHVHDLEAKLERLHDKGYQILDPIGDVPTLYIEFAGAAPDLAAMRQRALDISHDVTPTLGDRDMATELHWADHRRALVRWSRAHQRVTTTSGIGEIQIADPRAGEVRVRGRRDDSTIGKKIECAGTLHNPQTTALKGVIVRCVRNARLHDVPVGDIAPGADAPYAQVFMLGEDEELGFSVEAAERALEVIDDDEQARLAKMLDIAVALYDATKVSYDSYASDDTRIEVHAPPTFATITDEARAELAQKVWDRVAAMRPLLDIGDRESLTLRFTVELDARTYDYDGSTLSRSD